MAQNISKDVRFLYRLLAPACNRASVLLVALLLFPAAGCRQGPADEEQLNIESPTPSTQTQPTYSERLRGLMSGVEKRVGQARKSLPGSDEVQTKTSEEIQKLFRWEYHVLELPQDATAGRLEGELMVLGSEGWECFSITTHGTVMRLTCKRRPKSVLNYMKYIPFM